MIKVLTCKDAGMLYDVLEEVGGAPKEGRSPFIHVCQNKYIQKYCCLPKLGYTAVFHRMGSRMFILCSEAENWDVVEAIEEVNALLEEFRKSLEVKEPESSG